MQNKPLISFDYAIKYLLKHKGDYDIVEHFISAVIGTCGYHPVKINALLESESNKEHRMMKKSIADLVVEDEDGNKYVVEIERSYSRNFLHKALFNSARLVVDSISENQDYVDIKKVFHINILYFKIQSMKQPIYHGKTIIHEIDTEHPVDYKIVNQKLETFKTTNIFPEYFILQIPQFEDVINSEIDEWLYVMKNCDVHEEFKSPYMEKVKERLNVLKMNELERNEYIYYMKKTIESTGALNAAEEKGLQRGLQRGLEKGREEGLKQGEQQAHLKQAKRMLELGSTVEFVVNVTGLSIQQVNDIAFTMSKEKK